MCKILLATYYKVPNRIEIGLCWEPVVTMLWQREFCCRRLLSVNIQSQWEWDWNMVYISRVHLLSSDSTTNVVVNLEVNAIIYRNRTNRGYVETEEKP